MNTNSESLAESLLGASRVVGQALHYTGDYGTLSADVRGLYEKSKERMWSARTDIAWETPVNAEAENFPDASFGIYHTPIWARLDPKREVPNFRRHMWSYFLSNFLHGEQGALLAASQIVAGAATTDSKLYAAAQVYDEARHVEAYERYLREKVELIYPPSPHLLTLLENILTDTRWDFKYLGMQVMVEGLALGAFGLIHKMSSEPLIKQITEMIMRDEARHVAFGIMSLKGFYHEMGPSELRDREDFIIDAARLLRDRFLAQEVWERLGLPQRECEEAVRQSPTLQIFRTLLFSKIVPNVKRLGLLTPYVRSAFEGLEILQFEFEDAKEDAP